LVAFNCQEPRDWRSDLWQPGSANDGPVLASRALIFALILGATGDDAQVIANKDTAGLY
jgi:hypothetical protein